MSSQAAELTTVFIAERGRLLRLICRIIGDRAAAEDLVQEAFLKVSAAVTKNTIEDHRRYLVRTATNLAVDYRRHLGVARPAADSEAELLLIADQAETPEGAIAARQAGDVVNGVLARLPARTRRAFELHRFHERTMADIGRELGVSTALVHHLITEAYAAIRSDLRNGGFLPGAPAENPPS